MIFLYVFLAIILLLFIVVFIGAPYVPTLRSDARRILKLYPWSKKDVLVDIGSGDGLILRLLSPRINRAIGYELSPIIFIISWFLSRRYKNVDIICKNFWNEKIPKETTVVYGFLAERYMKKCQNLLQAHVDRTRKPIHFISYSFKLPDRRPIKQDGPMILYKITPLQS